MFKSIDIENFKAFSDYQKIPLKPITLIFGANSSGKSSIIQSLAYIHHAINTGNLDVHHTVKGGDSIDLGGIEQMVHRHDLTNRLEWGVTIDNDQLNSLDFNLDEADQPDLWSNPHSLFDDKTSINVSLSINVELDDQDRPKEDARPVVENYKISSGELKFLMMGLRPNGDYKVEYLNWENELTKRILNSLFGAEIKNSSDTIEDTFDQILTEIEFKSETILPSSIKNLKELESKVNSEHCRFLNFISSFVQNIAKIIQDQLDNFEYLGPLRSFPPRVIELAEENDSNFKAGGGFAWKKILEKSAIREEINEWLSSDEFLNTSYTLDVKYLHTIDSIEENYTPEILHVLEEIREEDLEATDDKWGDYFVAAESILTEIKYFEDKIADRKELVLTDHRTKTKVSHRDIGIGVSQVLPVLVSALGYEDKLIAIEQPEIHLHPNLQAAIGKVFEEGFKKRGNNFLIETHSEHLVKAIQLLVAKHRKSDGKEGLSQEEVSIIYVSNSRNTAGAQIKVMELNEKGSFKEPWPDDFFEKSSHLTLERLRTTQKESSN